MQKLANIFGDGGPLQMPFVDITAAEARRGCTFNIELPRQVRCARCGGTGAQPGTSYTRCDECEGEGQTRHDHGFLAMTTPCPACGGAGGAIEAPCEGCSGKGLVPETELVTVTVPPDTPIGTVLSLPGQGHDRRTPDGGRGELAVGVRIDGVFQPPSAPTQPGQKAPNLWLAAAVTAGLLAAAALLAWLRFQS